MEPDVPVRYSVVCGNGRRPNCATAPADLVCRLHRKTQAEHGQNRRQRVDARIAFAGKGAVQGFPRKSRLLGECRHTAHGIGDRAQRDRYRTRVAIFEHGLNVRGDLGLALEVVRRLEWLASAYRPACQA